MKIQVLHRLHFEGAGLTGRRTNLIADVSYPLHYSAFSPHYSSLLNVASTGKSKYFSSSHHSPIILIVPAIIYIDKWARRPMLLIGTLLMESGCSLSEVSGEHLENGRTLVEQTFRSLQATWLQRER